MFSDGDLDMEAMEGQYKREAPTQMITGKMARLVDWNCDVLQRLLRQVVAHRVATASAHSDTTTNHDEELLKSKKKGKTVIDEVVEIIHLPKFDSKVAANEVDSNSVELPPEALKQLRDFVEKICSMYRDNPFHNFEHARYVKLHYFRTSCSCRRYDSQHLVFHA